MSITSVETDYDNLTITLIADFDAPIEHVWDLWSDPRTVRVRLTERDGGTRMKMHSRFETRQDMERMVNTGTVDGLLA